MRFLKDKLAKVQQQAHPSPIPPINGDILNPNSGGDTAAEIQEPDEWIPNVKKDNKKNSKSLQRKTQSQSIIKRQYYQKLWTRDDQFCAFDNG